MTARRVPNDPQRRERIVRAAVELMTRDGLHTLTHRRVAAHAGVPLGSTTYWFRDLDELLAAAVELAIEQGRERIRSWVAALPPNPDVEQLCRALAVMTVANVTDHHARAVLDYELYVAGVRRPGLRGRSDLWIGLWRTVLREHVDPLTADALVAAADGYTLQSLLAAYPPTVAECEALLLRVVAR